MKNKRPLQAILILVLVFSLTACNLPSSKPSATATQAATAVPPSATPLPPPTETATPEPPTATPTEELLPTATLPIVNPTREPSKTPTKEIIKPPAHARFDGTFEYGKLVLRIDNNPAYIVPKTVTIKGAPCKEGKGKLSDSLTLEPPTYYEIVENRFYIDFGGGMVKISGEFISPLKARGTITIAVKVEGKNCTVGPYPWTASAPVE